MRFMTTGIAACAASLLVISPASACSWGKTASAENMTVADSSISTQDSADISIATNDISDEVAGSSGAVAVVGFVIVGFAAVIGAYVFRKRKG